MTEEYLHFIWRTKRFLAAGFKTSDGLDFEIKKAGIHNAMLAGPDFNHAQIRIDELEWHGPVEIHVKSSDWYKHEHHKDQHYNSVILHVVYEHDKDVVQNGRILPTFELKPYIDWQHYEQFEQFRNTKHEIACAASLLETDRYFLESMMTKAILDKWNDKICVLQEYIDDPDDAMFTFLGAAFGGHLNMHPFLQTIAVLPRERLKSMAPKTRYSMLLSQSGMFESNSRSYERWHFKGTRPGNFPTKRLYQFVNYIHDDQLKLLVELARPEEILKHFDEIMKPKDKHLKLSMQFKLSLLINAVVPYMNYLSQLSGNEKYQETAFQLLQMLPPEQNSITKKWKSIGILPKNAWETQGLLALHRYYCKAKKCLSCEVGNAVIRKG